MTKQELINFVEDCNIYDKMKLKTLTVLSKKEIIKVITETPIIITNATKYAYKIGDKDEAFSKHIAFTLSAIFQGKTSKNPYDYKQPGDNDNIKKIKKLKKKWKKVDILYSLIGKKDFINLLKKSKKVIGFDTLIGNLKYGLGREELSIKCILKGKKNGI